MTTIELANHISEKMEQYSVVIQNQTVDNKLQFRALAEFNGAQWDVSPWLGITDAHLASIKMLEEINNKLAEEAAKYFKDREKHCPRCDGDGLEKNPPYDVCAGCLGNGHLGKLRNRAVACSHEGGMRAARRPTKGDFVRVLRSSHPNLVGHIYQILEDDHGIMPYLLPPPIGWCYADRVELVGEACHD